MTQEWKPEELRATADEIREAVMPKSITPEMVGGTLAGLVDGVAEAMRIAEETKVTPQAQVSTTAESKEYVYSTGGETEQTTVMSMGDTTIAVQGDSVVFRKGMWNPAGASGQYVTVPIPGATSTHAGVMSAADKVKLDSLESDVSAKLSYAFLPFNGIVLLSVTVEQQSTADPVGIYWVSSQGCFAAKGSNGKFYANWIETEDFALRTHYEQYDQILYVCEGELYAVISGALVKLSDSDKVDKVSGKGLSTNDFTNALRNQLQNANLALGKLHTESGGNLISWGANHNANGFVTTGTYRIKGQRTNNTDNLPIGNVGSGHTLDGILYVFDSSLTSGTGQTDDYTITQLLVLSNRVGGQEGGQWIRSGYGVNRDSLVWRPWAKMQTNMEVGVVNDMMQLMDSAGNQTLNASLGMNSLVDNGIYSGVYIPGSGTSPGYDTETFVMVVINNYAVAGSAKTITQVKFATLASGAFTFEQRQRKLGSTSWSAWESVTSGGSMGIKVEDRGDDGVNLVTWADAEALASEVLSSGLNVGDMMKGTSKSPYYCETQNGDPSAMQYLVRVVDDGAVAIHVSTASAMDEITWHEIRVKKDTAYNCRVVSWDTYVRISDNTTLDPELMLDVAKHFAENYAIKGMTLHVDKGAGLMRGVYNISHVGDSMATIVESLIVGGDIPECRLRTFYLASDATWRGMSIIME